MRTWTSVAAALAFCCSAAFALEPTALSSDALRAAVAKASGAPVANVELLTASTTTSAELRFVSMRRDHTTKSMIVRLECMPRVACLPFYALVHGPLPTAASVVTKRTSPNELLIRAGENARLHVETGRLRLSTQVTCLQNGTAGAMIRVRDTATKRVTVAQVIDRGLVREIVR